MNVYTDTLMIYVDKHMSHIENLSGKQWMYIHNNEIICVSVSVRCNSKRIYVYVPGCIYA